MNHKLMLSLQKRGLLSATFWLGIMTAVTGTAAPLQVPDRYTLNGPRQVQVTYAPASGNAKAFLTYRDRHRSREFFGAEIRSSETALGQFVTVSFIDPDQSEHTTRTFSFFLPDINMGSEQSVRFTTRALYTVTRSGLEPTPEPGPHQDYRRQVVLSGFAMRGSDWTTESE